MESLSENIALLQMVNQFPGVHAEAPGVKATVNTKIPRLSPLKPEHEVEIVQYLAFLSAYSDSAKSVLALCIEATDSPMKLTIRWAANTGIHDAYVQGIGRIANVLMQQAQKGKQANYKSQMLDEVVNLNRKRILSRLRSRHAAKSQKVKDKPRFLQTLEQAVSLCRAQKQANPLSTQLDTMVRNLLTELISLEKLTARDVTSVKGHKILLRLLEIFHQLDEDHMEELRLALERIPLGAQWNGESFKSIEIRIKKMAHYSVASKRLLRAARRYNHFKRIVIRHVNLQGEFSSHSMDATQSKGLWQIYTKSKADKALPLDETTKSALARCEVKFKASQIETKLRTSIKNKKRLHAELQLILFYEQTKEQSQWPRVVCATKSACFLCSIFMQHHGLFSCPSSHAKIYDSWAVPKSPFPGLSKKRDAYLQQVIVQVNETVKKRLLEDINKSVTASVYHNESMVRLVPSTFTLSELSALSLDPQTPAPLIGPGRITEVLPNLKQPQERTGELPELVSNSTVVKKPVANTVPPNDNVNVTIRNDVARTCCIESSDTSVHSSTPASSLFQPCSADSVVLDDACGDSLQQDIATHLIRGVPFTLVLTWDCPVLVYTPKIHIEFSFSMLEDDTEISIERKCLRKVMLSIEWLSEEAVETTCMKEGIDLNENWRERAAIHGVALKMPGLLLYKGKHVVSIRVIYGNTD